MPNKKNMASRYATAHARRDARRRPDARLRPSLSDPIALEDSREPGTPAPVTGPAPARPLAPRPVAAPRGDRIPLARPIGAAPRPALGRAAPRHGSALASTVGYSYLRGDLRRIILLSLSLLILLIVLNLLLNR